ncbi:hypothetical protein CC80DRAFT_286694 [Byssothecium circinans]|uniref:Uncharacterized protein n=1 Tax=Byssothecium circinans TaxID=147558 RepID=A0A6A5U8H8_9PLEO|nr:hypothetical protein CC80DRAFT_286694 [Byssothecium circinans]
MMAWHFAVRRWKSMHEILRFLLRTSPCSHTKIPSLTGLSSSYVYRRFGGLSNPGSIKPLFTLSRLRQRLLHLIERASTFSRKASFSPPTTIPHPKLFINRDSHSISKRSHSTPPSSQIAPKALAPSGGITISHVSQIPICGNMK